jgi:hypothetical protein
MLSTIILSSRRFCLCTAVLALALARSSVVASAGDVVLYSSDVSFMSGAWARLSSSTGAGGLKMTTMDAGWAALDQPLAAPANYFEARFDAPAGATYQVWLRLRAANNSKWNDSVWVQFSDAVDSTGSALWRLGTASGLLVNLEDCSGCGVSGWGWQDNASWSGQTARVRFATSGTHTVRVQLREDGVDIDQIVLSPVTWFSRPPGAATADATIVPKPSSGGGITFVRAPYLQQVTSGSATIVWATRENGAGEVRYQGPDNVVRVAPAVTRLVPATLTGMAENYYQHEAPLAALTASTSYAYTVSVGGIDGGGDRFTTAPPPGSGAVRLLAFGDSGVGSVPQRQLASLMAAETFDFAVHTGDVVYGVTSGVGAGGYPQLHSWFFDVYRNWLGSRPVFPSIGNHDEEANHAAPYRDVFVLPAGGASAAYPDHAERFYSFDYGPAHVVVLDTELAFQNVARRQDQLTWLADDLARTAQPWKIAVFHRSPFSAGGEHGSDLTVRAEFAPIFEAYGVGLVLSGHEHDYERTIPWRQTSGGTPVTYIVTGGGGAPLYPAGVAAWTAASRSAFHYLRATITSCTISVEAVGLEATVFDATRLERCSSPPSSSPFGGVPIAVPGRLEAEAFDNGGEGVGYHDATAGNAGGRYRSTDVDIEATTDPGGGYNVGWMSAGEWLVYSIDVAASGSYTLDARVAAAGPGGTMHFEVDGSSVTGPLVIPDTGGWQNWQSVAASGVQLSAGRHRLRLVADANGPTGVFSNINYVHLSASGAPPAPEVVIYATDIARTVGAWRSVPDASAANGMKLVTADLGWATIDAPLPSPNDYLEATFDAPAGIAYRLWLRLRATGDTKYSESVWVQFSDALTTGGAPIHGIGTSRALLVNLENCAGCGVAGWGWQDRAYWLADASTVRFANSGTHTIRIQVREDGAQLDQIVLSPSRYLARSPGALKNDVIIVPKQ